MKKIFTIVLVIFCTTSIMACKAKTKIEDNENNKETTDTQNSESISETLEMTEIEESDESDNIGDASTFPDTGDWSINEKFSPDDNPDAVSALNNAAETIEDYHYEVVAVLSSQVVAGMNYELLCKGKALSADAKTEYVIVKLAEDLSKNAYITWSENILGGDAGWEYNESSPDIKENPDVEAVFNKAANGLTGVNYELIAYIGKKDNSYAVLAKITTVSEQPMSSIGLIYMTSNDDGVTIDDIRGY